jgi:hypothetical protein
MGRCACIGVFAAAGRRRRICMDASDRAVHGGGHGGVHGIGIGCFHEQGLPAVAAQQALQLLVWDAGQQGGVGDLCSR